MTDSETTVDLEDTRSSHASYMGVVTRSLRSYRRMESDDPASYDLDILVERLESLATTERRCLRTLDTLQGEESYPHMQEKDEETGEIFIDNVRTTSALLKRFMALRQAQELIAPIRKSLESMETIKLKDPTKDCSSSIARLIPKMDALSDILKSSTIHADHEIRLAALDFESRLIEPSSKDITLPSIPIAVTSSTAPSKPKSVHHHKLNLPSFSGNLMDWASFWSQFEATVDSDPGLTPRSWPTWVKPSRSHPSCHYSFLEWKEITTTIKQLLSSRRDLINPDRYMLIIVLT